jgi:hypothetical protein
MQVVSQDLPRPATGCPLTCERVKIQLTFSSRSKSLGRHGFYGTRITVSLVVNPRFTFPCKWNLHHHNLTMVPPKVVRIPIQILESYDFTTLQHHVDPNPTMNPNLIESMLSPDPNHRILYNIAKSRSSLWTLPILND